MIRDKTFVTYWEHRALKVPQADKLSDLKHRRPVDVVTGWSCWVYAATDLDFTKWMKENMTGEYDAIYRFNSGDPMYTVFIKEDVDATLFKLKFL